MPDSQGNHARNTVDILGVPVDYVTMGQAVEKVGMFLKEEKVHTVYTPNAEIMMAAQRDPGLKKILCEADLLVADGAGVVLASKILNRSVPERVPGIELVTNVFQAFSRQKLRCFLLGGKPGVAEIAAATILHDYPGVEIAGCRNGYFSKEDETAILEQINASKAHILLVALGAPKQERLIEEHKDQLNVRVCFGVGGTLDTLAGVTERAPEFFRRNGLEWLFRLYKEPWRFKRMLDLPRFILKAMKTRLTARQPD